jgi:hypothetical protein
MGSWASVGEHENKIEEEGEVDHVEADQSLTSPAPERAGNGQSRAAAASHRRPGGALCA